MLRPIPIGEQQSGGAEELEGRGDDEKDVLI